MGKLYLSVNLLASFISETSRRISIECGSQGSILKTVPRILCFFIPVEYKPYFT
jgi:hypothetical protein